MIGIRLHNAMDETERRFLALIVDFDVLRTRLVDLVWTYRHERASLKRQIPPDAPAVTLDAAVPTSKPKRRKRRTRRKHAR